jgi:N-acetylmuramoyl-L-alanine amidase
MAESYRTDYDDAIEVGGDGCEDIVGVATFSVDRHYDGTPTGAIDELPVRVYVLDPSGDATGEAGRTQGAYLTLDSARELRDAIDAAIVQVELTRHRRRRSAHR